MLLISGTVMAMVNGTVMPLMCIVFGEMTDSFISSEVAKQNISHSSELLLKHITNRTPDSAMI